MVWTKGNSYSLNSLIVLTLLALTVSLSECIGQDARLKLKSGETVETKINASTKAKLWTANGNFNFSEIQTISFKEESY